MRKIYLLFISFFLFLIACNKEPKLTFMVGGAPNEIAYWEKLVKDFSAKSGKSVELIRQSTDTNQRKQGLMIALRGKKKDPDIMLVDVAWIDQFALSGWLEPLDDYNIDSSVFFDSVISLADMANGSLIGLPLYVDGGLLYYRKDLLSKYSYTAPPTTWQQLVDISLQIQEKERGNNPDFWGYVWQGAEYEGLICNALEVFVSANGGFLDNSGLPTISSTENIMALQFMHDMVNKYKISPPNTFSDMKEEEVRLMFHNGMALFERNWPYAWGLHAKSEDSAVKDQVGIAPLPHFAEGQSASTLGGWHVVISKFSDTKEDSVQFLKYITSYDVQKRFAMDLGWNPGRKDVYADNDVKNNAAHLVKLKDVFTHAVPRPSLPYYGQVSKILQKYINAAISGKMDAEDALESAQKEVLQVIDEFGDKKKN